MKPTTDWSSAGTAEEVDDGDALVSKLVATGKHWVFEVKDDNWYLLIHQLVKRELWDKGITNPESFMIAKAGDKEYAFLLRKYFSVALMSERLNVPPPELEESTIIVLEPLDVIGQSDPPDPTVEYYGTA